MKPKTQEQLLLELEDLRARLDEAEETLRAIRSGEADALVVSGVDGEQVFTLKGAEHSYRMLIEDMSEGALIMTAEGVILYANRSFAGMLKTPLEKVIGSMIHTWIAPEGQRILQSSLRKGVDKKRRAELVLAAGDGTLAQVYLSVSNLLIDEMPDSFCLVATDLTEQKRSDAIAASEKLARELLAASNQSRLALLSVIEDQELVEERLHVSEENFRRSLEESLLGVRIVSKEGETLYVNRATLDIFGCDSIEEWQTTPSVKRYTEQSYAAFKVRREKRRLGEDDSSEYGIDIVRKDGEVRHLQVWRKMVLWDGKKHYQVIYRDITERKLSEERLKRQFDRLAALRAIDMAITASLDIRVTFNVLLGQVVSCLGVDAADILILNSQSYNKLTFVAGRGFRTSALRHTNLTLGAGYAGRVALERKTICIPDLQKESQDILKQSPQLSNEDFVTYCGTPLIAKGHVRGVLEIFNRTPLEPDQEWLDFLEALAVQAAIAIDNVRLFDDLQKSNIDLLQAYDNTLEGWSNALDLRDKETEGHSQRVTEMTLRLARQMGMRDSELVHVRRGALLHDIGKMGIPDNILLKPGALTDEEWVIMRKHPVYAYELLYPISYLRPALDIPYSHHEKWDGTGYPRGLKGEHIPLAARIFSIVDVWDALRSERPYRPAWPEEKTLEHIRELTGTHFDPKVVEAFLELLNELKPV
ncbi:MAG: PAS domain S-box protein [Chloroflexi bacterium]|nr:PAS domain S-box protein [Chloroflexota bacterium]